MGIMELTKIPFFKRLRTKVIFYLVIVLALITSVLSATLYLASYRIITRNTSDSAFSIAEAAAKRLDVDKLKELKTQEDEQKESYKTMRQQLFDIRETTGAKYIYTMTKNEDGEFIYVVDGSVEEDLSHIGDTEEPIEGYEQAWSGQTYKGDKIEDQDEWGILISSYYPLKDSSGATVGFLGVDYDAESAFKGLQNLKTLVIVMPMVIVLVIGVLGAFVTSYITKPIIQVSEASNRVANNDLTVDKLNIKSKSELGVLAEAFNKMLDNIKSMHSSLQGATIQLAESSGNISNSIEELSASSEEVSKGIQDIASGADVQIQESERTYEMASSLSQKVADITIKLSLAMGNASVMKDKNDLGANAISDLSNNFSEYFKSAQEIGAKIDSLSDKSKSIESILMSINSIADQTNLLALNAAIEAARAGEHGRGFAVVAEEVRKLAEQSSSSTKEIQSIVNNIVADIANVETVLSESRGLIDGVKSSIDVSKNSFADINASVKDTIGQIEGLSTDISNVEEAKDIVLKAVENISTTMQQSVAATQEISASAEQQTASAEEISMSVQSLDEMVKSLSEMISKYKLS
jgi:methyl-accepting chemotaxis protein